MTLTPNRHPSPLNLALTLTRLEDAGFGIGRRVLELACLVRLTLT